MKRTSVAWNLLAATTLLGAALATAVGCPAKSNPPPATTNAARPAADKTPAAVPHAGGETPSGAENQPAAADPRPTDPPDPTPAANVAISAADESAGGGAIETLDDWPAPKYALFITGRQNGYIEPCGCAGLDNQKGGMARRHTLVDNLRAKGWDVVPLDAGNQVRRYGRQAEIKFQVTAQALDKMGYRAVAFGPDDLQLSSGELIAVVSDASGKPSPFISANANLFGLTQTHLVIQAGGERIGVTAILGSDQLKRLHSAEIEKTTPEEGLRKVVPQLESAGCDLLVLLANAGYEESKSLAEAFPQFDVVIAAAGTGEPPPTLETVGRTQVVVVGEKAMYAGVLGVYDDPENRVRYQRVPLDKALADSSYMMTLLATYQDALKSEGLAGLDLRPVAHPSGYDFVGSSRCGECHTKAFAVWEKTPHSRATETLVRPPERYEVPRHHDPECLSCHVTGWDPQGYFPFASGYADLEKTPLLIGNGCENCHGPGSRHAAAESGDLNLDVDAVSKLRDEMRLPLARAEKRCQECHDLDNDPHFQHEGAFAEYWEKIKHPGKD